MASFHGKRVSAPWALVLRWAEKEGVRFLLNSGRRIKAEQLALIAEKGLWSPSNPTGAAPYSPFAPHIRVGRPDHAVDINSLDGGETRLERWVNRKLGKAAWKNTVPGESWHGELALLDLLRLARMARKALADPLKGYRRDEKRWIREYDNLVQHRRDPERRRVLQRVMGKRATHIRKQATKSKLGWKRFRRHDRWRSLRTRADQ